MALKVEDWWMSRGKTTVKDIAMPDITLCSPTKYLPKCKNCYRRNAKPSEWQSYSNFYDECKDEKYEYYLPNKSRKHDRLR